MVGRFIERLPVLRGDAIDEQVGIEGGRRHQRQHAAGGRLDRDQGATAVAEGVLGDALQLDVERQFQIVARRGRRARQGAHRASAGIDLDLLDARGAVQFMLVELLQPGLADMLRAAVVGGIRPPPRCARRRAG